MAVTAEAVKQLRERTGAGMMECKKALVETNGDLDAAAELMRKSGLAKADKKAARVAAEGVIVIERSADGKRAAVVEVNCETDFVARENGFVRFTSAQSEYSLVERGVEAGVLPACRDLGLGFLPYFPLKSGLLTGKYTREGGTGRLTTRPKILAGANWEQLDAYRALCDEHGLTMLQASIGWLLAQDPVSSVISGATTPEQVAQNAGAGEIALPDALLDQIGELF